MPAGWASFAGNGEHNQAQRKYRQTDELECHDVHGQIPQDKSRDCSGAVDRRLICGARRASPGLMLSGGLTIYVPQNVRSTR